jgi:hypothetical protein
VRRVVDVACSRVVLLGALKVSLFVGTVLNLVNQREAWRIGVEGIDVVRGSMNFVVPFTVSAYSATVALLRRRREEGASPTAAAGGGPTQRTGTAPRGGN